MKDCGLAGNTSAPQHQSLYNGLAVDTPVLRFNKGELAIARSGVFVGALVELAYARASTGDLLAPPPRQKLTREEAMQALDKRVDPDARVETSSEDFRIWGHLIETATGLPEYKEMGETAGALAGIFPYRKGYMQEPLAAAIREARKIIKARGDEGGDMQWVMGVPDLTTYELEQLAGFTDFVERMERLWAEGPSSDTLQEGKSDLTAAGDQNLEVPEDVQGPSSSDLTDENQVQAAGSALEPGQAKPSGDPMEELKELAAKDKPEDSGPARSTEDSRGAEQKLSEREGGQTWAGFIKYFVALITDNADDKEALGEQANIAEDDSLGKASSAEKNRTWVGLIKYLWDLLKKLF